MKRIGWFLFIVANNVSIALVWFLSLSVFAYADIQRQRRVWAIEKALDQMAPQDIQKGN